MRSSERPRAAVGMGAERVRAAEGLGATEGGGSSERASTGTTPRVGGARGARARVVVMDDSGRSRSRSIAVTTEMARTTPVVDNVCGHVLMGHMVGHVMVGVVYGVRTALRHVCDIGLRKASRMVAWHPEQALNRSLEKIGIEPLAYLHETI